jgi:hypothetical protein
MTPEKAEILALEGLGWMAGEPEAIEKFLSLSGLEPGALREAATDPQTGVAVLDFLLADEPLLLKFCDSRGIDPRQVQMARQVLARDTVWE